jgi:hypothetical protein
VEGPGSTNASHNPYKGDVASASPPTALADGETPGREGFLSCEGCLRFTVCILPSEPSMEGEPAVLLPHHRPQYP